MVEIWEDVMNSGRGLIAQSHNHIIVQITSQVLWKSIQYKLTMLASTLVTALITQAL